MDIGGGPIGGGPSGIWGRARSEKDAKLLLQEQALHNKGRPDWSPMQKRLLLAAVAVVLIAMVVSAIVS